MWLRQLEGCRAQSETHCPRRLLGRGKENEARNDYLTWLKIPAHVTGMLVTFPVVVSDGEKLPRPLPLWETECLQELVGPVVLSSLKWAGLRLGACVGMYRSGVSVNQSRGLVLKSQTVSHPPEAASETAAADLDSEFASDQFIMETVRVGPAPPQTNIPMELSCLTPVASCVLMKDLAAGKYLQGPVGLMVWEKFRPQFYAGYMYLVH